MLKTVIAVPIEWVPENIAFYKYKGLEVLLSLYL